MRLVSFVGLLVLLGTLAGRANAEPGPAPAWCAEDVETLAEGMCYFEPPPVAEGGAVDVGPECLVLFLHSLVQADSDWQWQQQRLMKRAARASSFAVLMPRGRPGIGPGRDPRVLAWPGSAKAQEAVEAELVAEWDGARALVERRRGRRFERLFVFGFSNGAYYATTLAVRDRYPADGYGIFAGGNGSKYHRLLASKVERRVPIFVGYGTRDEARADMSSLAKMLSDLRWPYRVNTAPIGHWVSDAQLRAALQFLRQ